MVLNFDGLHEIRLFYTTTPTGHPAMEHRHTFDVAVSGTPDVGVGFDEISLLNHNATTQALDVFVTAYLAVIADLHSTATVFNRFEYWRIPEGTYDALFVSAETVSGETGTIASTALVTQQDTYTFRSVNGNPMRMQFMEAALLGLQGRSAYPTVETEVETYMDFVTASDQPFLARDNSRPFFSLAWNGSKNKKLWKKRYRP